MVHQGHGGHGAGLGGVELHNDLMDNKSQSAGFSPVVQNCHNKTVALVSHRWDGVKTLV